MPAKKKVAKKAAKQSKPSDAFPDMAALPPEVLRIFYDLLGGPMPGGPGKRGKGNGLLQMIEGLGGRRRKRTRAAKATSQVYRIKVTLKHSSPPIWRRIEVKDCSLQSLHDHIQQAMGWESCHLYQFTIDGAAFGEPEHADGMDMQDASRTLLSQIVPEGKERFRFLYEYDFGDGWDHDILVEKCLPEGEKDVKYPRCVAGKRACPPEDCGGIYGYGELLEAIADPKHELHAEAIESYGPFDPEAFDALETTKRM